MRLIIAGSRDMPERIAEPFIRAHGSAFGAPSVVLHGACRGVDAAADRWCARWNVPVERYPADWSAGKSAGPKRNAEMVSKADALLCIHFPDSRGSADVLRQARAKGLLVVEVVVPPC